MPEKQRAAVTIAEAAEMYGVSPKTLNTAIKAGSLVAKNIGEGLERVHARIAVKDLQSWFEGLPDA